MWTRQSCPLSKTGGCAVHQCIVRCSFGPKRVFSFSIWTAHFISFHEIISNIRHPSLYNTCMIQMTVHKLQRLKKTIRTSYCLFSYYEEILRLFSYYEAGEKRPTWRNLSMSRKLLALAPPNFQYLPLEGLIWQILTPEKN